MTAVILDCSVTMAWCFGDEDAPVADRALTAVEADGAAVPSIWSLEVGNVLVAAERRGRIARADSARFLALLEALPIRVDPETAGRAWPDTVGLAREHRLSTYDAAYLELASRRGAPLLTLDQELKRVATVLGVETDVNLQ